MSLPKFKIAVNNFDNSREEKLFNYLAGIIPLELKVLAFSFKFSSFAEYKIKVFQQEAEEANFLRVNSQAIGHRGKPKRFYLTLQKQVELKKDNLLREMEYLKGLAQRYGVNFYEIEPEKG